jgi:membrane protein YdbS with pleckstrin-like domain
MTKEDFTDKLGPDRDDRRQDDPEEQLWTGNYSVKDMYGLFAMFGVVSIAAVIGSFFAFSILPWVIGGVVLLWIVLGLRLGLKKMGVRYKLTTQRFFHEKGIIKRTMDRLEVIDIDDIAIEQGILDRMFNVGTIKITSSDRTHPVLVLDGIEDVKEVFDMMDNARRKERIRRGIHIEAV